MANYKKILKNTTGFDIEIDEFGLTVPASGQITIEPGRYLIIAEEVDVSNPIDTLISSGDIVVNDGVRDITIANDGDVQRAIDYLKASDRCFNVRFETEPERSNNFPTDTRNAQEAIEFAKSGAIENDLDKLQFAKQGTISNNAYLLTLNNLSSADSPDTLAYSMIFRRMSLSVSNIPATPFTVKIWTVDYDHTNPTIIYTETFSAANGNWSGHAGYTQTEQDILIPATKGIYVQMGNDLDNPKPSDINVMLWMRQA